jgi:hypothetical protein
MPTVVARLLDLQAVYSLLDKLLQDCDVVQEIVVIVEKQGRESSLDYAVVDIHVGGYKGFQLSHLQHHVNHVAGLTYFHEAVGQIKTRHGLVAQFERVLSYYLTLFGPPVTFGSVQIIIRVHEMIAKIVKSHSEPRVYFNRLLPFFYC